MTHRRIMIAAGLASGLLWASAADASTITVQAQVGAGPLVIEGIPSSTGFINSAFAIGGYFANLVTGLEATSPDVFTSNAQDQIRATDTATGILNIYVTIQGLTAPTGAQQLLSSFTSNSLPAGWTVTESTFYSLANGLPAATNLASHTFSGPLVNGTASGVNLVNLLGPYSLTELYTINPFAGASGQSVPGSSNSTIDIAASVVPLPGALPLFGTGLGMLGLLAVRRKKARA